VRAARLRQAWQVRPGFRAGRTCGARKSAVSLGRSIRGVTDAFGSRTGRPDCRRSGADLSGAFLPARKITAIGFWLQNNSLDRLLAKGRSDTLGRQQGSVMGNSFGVWLAIGIGIGTALGAAFHNLAIGVGLGVSIGMIAGSLASYFGKAR
jgi:hypothetical protein